MHEPRNSTTDPKAHGAAIGQQRGWGWKRLHAGFALISVLTITGCSGPAPIADDTNTQPDAGGPNSTGVTPMGTDDEPTNEPEPIEEVYTCGDVNAVPYEGRLLTRAQYQNTVTDLFGGAVKGVWTAGFPAENEVGGFRTNAESHRATSWLAEAHLTAAEAISAEVRRNLSVLAPCAVSSVLTNPSADSVVQASATECARNFLATYGFRAFRRPLTAAEEQPFLSLFETGYQAAGAPYGLELLTQALLLSPQFLYRVEQPIAPANQTVDGELVGSFGLASRLSFLLWNSMPDEELLAAAQSGALEQPETLRAQAERLLASPKAQNAIRDFAEQWLGLGTLTGAVRRPPATPNDAEPVTTDNTTTNENTQDDSPVDTASVDPTADDTTEAVDAAADDITTGENTSDDSSVDAGPADTEMDTSGASTRDTETQNAPLVGSTSTQPPAQGAPPVDEFSTTPLASAERDTNTAPTSDSGVRPRTPITDGEPTLEDLANNRFSNAWRGSILEFVASRYANDSSFADLMLSNQVFVDAELASLYGVTSPKSDAAFEAVDFPESERAGLLTQPGLMAMLAHSDQSAPILRGVFVLDALLCQPPPPAPASVDTTPPKLDPNATTRERFLQHTEDPACSGCHQFIDPIGLGLENYDELGRYRDNENGLAVDASGKLVGLRDQDANGTFDGAVDLAKRLSESAQAQACFVSKWYQYASGRGEGSRDACTTNELKASFAASGGKLRELLVAYVLSDAFRYRTLEAPGALP